MSPDLEMFIEMFIEQEVASGRFPDREAFISYAVSLVKLDREDALAGIQAGLEEAFASIRRKIE